MHSFHRGLAATLLALPGLAAAGTPYLTLESASHGYAVGNAAEIRVMIHDVPAVAGVQLTLKYDPAALRVVDADTAAAGTQSTPGTFFDAQHFFVVRNDANAKTGELTYVASELYPAKEVRGDGELLRFRVAPSLAGDTKIAVTNVRFGNFAGQPVAAANGEPLALHVEGGGTFLSQVQQQALPAPVAPGLPWSWILGGAAALLAVAGAFWLGRRSRATPAA